MGKSSKLIKAFLDSVRGLKSSQKEKSGSLNHGNARLTCNYPGMDDGDYKPLEVKKEKRRWRSFGKSASINRSSDMVLVMQSGAAEREQQQYVAFNEELPDEVNLGCSDLYTKSRGAAVADCYTDISCIIIDEKLPLGKLKSDILKNAAVTRDEEINGAGVIRREENLTFDKTLDKSIVFLAPDRLDWAATRIQTAFRGYLARRAFRALKGLVRLQALARGRRVRKQAAATLRCVHALVRVQARIRAHQVRISEQGQAVQRRLHTARVNRQLQQQHDQQQQQAAAAATATSPAKPSMVIDPQHEWDCSPATTEQLQAKIQYRQVAAMRRERALAYAFSEQLRRCVPKGSTPFVIDCGSNGDKDNQWGWSWLERWMAAKPWQRGSFNPGLAREHVSVMNVMDATANTININNHIKPADHHHHHHGITDESKFSPCHHQQYHVDKNMFIKDHQADHTVYIKKRTLSIPEIMLNNIDSLLSQLNDQPASAIHLHSHKNASPIRSTSNFSNDATNPVANPSSPAANTNPRINKPAANCVQRSPTSHRQATGCNNIIKKQLPCIISSGQDQTSLRSRGMSQLAANDAVNDHHGDQRKAGLGRNYDHNDSINDEAAVKQNDLMITSAATAATPPSTPPNKGANYIHGTPGKASFNHWKAMATLSNRQSLIEQQSHHSEPGLVINDIDHARAAHNYGDSANVTVVQLPSYMQSTHSAKAKAKAAAAAAPGGSQSSAATRSLSPGGQSTPAAKSPSLHLTSPKANNHLSNASVMNGVSPPPKRRNSISSIHNITAATVPPAYIASSNHASNNLIKARIANSDHNHQRLISSHVAAKSSRGFSSSATSNPLVEMEFV